MHNKLITYVTLALMFGAGIILGTISALPGKNKSISVLRSHGIVDTSKDYYTVYMPNKEYITEVEFKALVVMSDMCSRVIVHYLRNINEHTR